MPRDAESEFQIEKGIPIPTHKHGGPGMAKYPWRQMEVGDSFFVSSETVRLATMEALARATQKRLGVKFSCRRMDGGLRIWRVA